MIRNIEKRGNLRTVENGFHVSIQLKIEDCIINSAWTETAISEEQQMRFKGWEKSEITTDTGEKINAIHPVIVSASRSTDIPAFYSKWFFNRLDKGYCIWINPFNHARQYIAFDKTRLFVFWSKNPEPLTDHLTELDRRNINYYFQFTVNAYEDDDLEPLVPPLRHRIDLFRRLSDQIGKQRVVWRFDPLVLTNRIDAAALVEKIFRAGEKISKYTEKLVISFADIARYKNVKRNLAKAGIQYKLFRDEDIIFIAKSLKKLSADLNLEVATCAEEMDLSAYGIGHNKCIDDELIINNFSFDEHLMKFLGVKNPYSNLFPELETVCHLNLKDRGQRKACRCIVSKDIGQYNTCPHLCRYCYANFSEKRVKENLEKRTHDHFESILEI